MVPDVQTGEFQPPSGLINSHIERNNKQKTDSRFLRLRPCKNHAEEDYRLMRQADVRL